MTRTEAIAILRMIEVGYAFDAETEYELEELGLIVQTHEPYARLTTAGHALLATKEH